MLISIILLNNYSEIFEKKFSIKENANKSIDKENLKQAIFSNLNKREKYSPNHQFVINNNLAQYSSYLIVDQNQITIEAFVHYISIFMNRNQFGGKENFVCVIRYLLNDNDDGVFELEAVDSPKFVWNYNQKLIYNLDIKKLKKDYDETKDLNLVLNNIVVAIIWKYDYDKNSNLNNLTVNNDKRIFSPYTLIKYQTPSIIYTQDPRFKTASLCVSYVFSIPNGLKNWIDINLSFGVKEIMIYDAVENRTLTKYLKNIYGNDTRIVVIPFNIELNDLCDELILFRNFQNIFKQLKEYLMNSCKKIFDLEFIPKFELMQRFQQINYNDCFTILKQKYEFIGIYDTDEYFYPRTLNIQENFHKNSTTYSCDDTSRTLICNKSQFNFKYNNSQPKNHLYDYLQSLIRENKNGRDIDKLSSIKFAHGAK